IPKADRKPLSFSWREESASIAATTDNSPQKAQEDEREEGELSDDEMGGVESNNKNNNTTAATTVAAPSTLPNPGKICSIHPHPVITSDSSKVIPPNPFMWPNPFVGDSTTG